MKLRTFPFERTAAAVVCAAGAAAVLWISGRWLLPVCLPFLLAWGLALLMRPAAVWLHRHTRVPRRVWSLTLVMLVPAAFVALVWLLSARLSREAAELLAWLEAHPERIGAFLERIEAPFSGLLSALPASVTDGGLPGQMLADAVDTVRRAAGQVLARAPGMLVFFFVTVVASVYFSWDLEGVDRRVLGLLPSGVASWLRRARKRGFSLAGRYVGAYLKLMGVTFLVLLAGFLIMRMPYALLLAAVFALVDFLPVLGVGTVLVPWALACFVLGRTARGVSLSLLWLVTVAVREFLEPRLVGRGLGVPPLWMLFCLYAGLRLFGLWGFAVGPVIAVVTRAFFAPVRPDETPPDDPGGEGRPAAPEK